MWRNRSRAGQSFGSGWYPGPGTILPPPQDFEEAYLSCYLKVEEPEDLGGRTVSRVKLLNEGTRELSASDVSTRALASGV